MFNKLYQVFYKSAKASNILLLAVAYIIFAGFILQWAQAKLEGFSSHTQPIDLHFSYSAEQAYNILKSYGGEGREWYTFIELTMNTVYPLIYTMLLSLLIISVFTKLTFKENSIKILFAIPIVTMLTDYAENACIIYMLVNYPYKIEWMAELASVLTNVKWIFFFMSVCLVAVGSLVLLIRFVRFKFIVKGYQAKIK